MYNLGSIENGWLHIINSELNENPIIWKKWASWLGIAA